MQEGPEPGHLHQERNNSKAPVAAQPGSSPDAGETAVGPRSAARAFARSVSRPVGVRPARQLRSPPQVRCLLPAAQLSNAPARRIQRLRGAGGVADGGVADGGGADGAGLAGVGLGLQGCGRCASGEMLGVLGLGRGLALGWTPSVGRMHARRPQSRHWCDPTHTPSCFRQPTRVLAA